MASMSAPRLGSRAPKTAPGRFDARALIWFYALAYALSWAWVIPWAATGHTVYQGSRWPTHLPSLLGPLLAAFAVTAWTGGAPAIRDLVSRMGRWQIGWRWWLAALSPIGFFAAGLAGLALTGNMPTRADFSRFSGIPGSIGLAAMILTVIVVNGFGEETGWRGYALPQLQRRFSPLTATLIVAAGWAGWHIPQFFYLNSYKNFQPAMLAVFAFGLACGAVVATWLYNRSGGSILAVVVWHGLYNALGATKAATSGSGVLASVIWTFVVANAIVLVILELRARRHGAPSVIGPR
jgi:membrane protease YdiL (CAAX protease family)